MTDEVQGNEENQDQTGESQNTPSPMEQEAREAGWLPKEEYTGDTNKWVSADEFVRRGELFKRIESQSRELKNMRKAIEDIQQLHTKSREVEYKRALETVRAEKKAALEDGDADAVIEADEKIDMLREAQRESVSRPTQTSSGEEHPAFVDWLSKNSWYESNRGMKAYADTIGAELQQKGLSPAEVLAQVAKAVRTEFPNRFKNPNQEKPNSVEGGSPGGSKTTKDNFVLSDTERGIMNNLIRLGVMTKESYIEELKKVKGD